MDNKCIIVIPIYKNNPDEIEKASFNQVLTILKKHNICIFTHKDCDLSVYKQISNRVGKQYSVEFFDFKYFKSIDGYNELCCSKDFYHRFEMYEYMLIYQLDAWIFRDELLHWCNKNYDYIGAPIYYTYNKFKHTNKFMGVGNGGFCLRKISYCLKVLSLNSRMPFINLTNLIKLYWNLLLYNENFKSFTNRIRIIPIILLKSVGIKNNLNYYITNHINEDIIFSIWSSKSWGIKANIPSKEEAIKFSFEVHPQLLFKENNYKLPFGCHAFKKWEFNEFWCNYIKINVIRENRIITD